MTESITVLIVEPVVEKKTVTLMPTISKTTPPIIANILFNSIGNIVYFNLIRKTNELGGGLGTE